MQHVQGYTGSHWTQPLGNARVTANKTTMENAPTLLAILMALVVHRYDTVHITQWRRFVAFLEATGHCHWASIHSYNIERTYQCRFFVVLFIVKFLKKATR
jgi:hypothetical protein